MEVLVARYYAKFGNFPPHMMIKNYEIETYAKLILNAISRGTPLKSEELGGIISYDELKPISIKK